MLIVLSNKKLLRVCNFDLLLSSAVTFHSVEQMTNITEVVYIYHGRKSGTVPWNMIYLCPSDVKERMISWIGAGGSAKIRALMYSN